MPAHPRVGGENAGVSGLDDDGRGSSPRGRGKRRVAPGVAHDRGLIPAWAGKTGAHRSRRSAAQAHPRVGGENLLPVYEALKSFGSSPRGRGKHNAACRCYHARGLIPAWAGKTSPRLYQRRGTWAHPRVGGENACTSADRASSTGSSPRGRGKLGLEDGGGGLHRLIPAWAGKTPPTWETCQTTQAHPRVGGENGGNSGDHEEDRGSSPRGRGKPTTAPPAIQAVRLIPAWAGKTTTPARRPSARTAHPRVGGENFLPAPISLTPGGSSPRGRGKHGAGEFRLDKAGLIPAWAGKT